MTSAGHRSAHKDSGAALLLAIGFMTMIGLISAGLASLTMSSLKNRSTLELVRDRQYAADGAIELAISQVRVLTCSSPSGFTEDTLNGVAIRVDWVNTCAGSVKSSDGSDVPQRNVVFRRARKPCRQRRASRPTSSFGPRSTSRRTRPVRSPEPSCSPGV